MFWRRKQRSDDPFGGGAMVVPTPSAAFLPARGDHELVLEAAGEQQIRIIKVCREATGLGLKEAKDLADRAPSSLGSFSAADAERLRAQIVAAGGRASVRRATGGSTPEPAAADTVELLERLVALRDRGALTEEEFAREKQRILGV